MSEHQQMQQSGKPDSTFQKQAALTSQMHVSHPASIIQRVRIDPKSLTTADVLQLQHTIGNRAVGRLLSEIRNPSKVQQVPIQRQEISEEEDEPIQGKMIGTVQRQEIPEEEPLQKKSENNTGMPDNLKAGVENLSGIDMSDVRVHYNSNKPAQVGALAYTQGTNIHVAPGQERHLPHEAWHVVQQAQGRVKPTVQMKGLAVNDEVGLEREADLMGRRANHVSCDSLQRNEVNEQDILEFGDNRAETALQRKLKNSITTLTRNSSKSSTIQCAWTTDEVNNILKKDPKGIEAVTNLNGQEYNVIHFDKYKFQRQFYTDAAKTVKDGPPIKLEKNGWHTRFKKEIALSDRRDNNGAASTLVHEVTHANQHKENEAANLAKTPNPFPDTLSKELDAHIKQEEFNIAVGIAPKDPTFRNEATGKIDKDAIKTYVERIYAVGAGKRYYMDTEPKYNVIENIKPWPRIE